MANGKNSVDLFRLTGKKAVVTGGNRGIGRHVAVALADAGADIAIISSQKEHAEEAKKEIESMGVKAMAVGADVREPDAVNAAFAEIEKEFGRVDILFNNAGVCINQSALEMTYEEWRKVIDINLTGAFLVAQAAGKIMVRQKKGCIINNASISGSIVNVPQPQCAYNASKAGLILLTKSLAVEWADLGVRVNSISPGYVDVGMSHGAPKYMVDTWMMMSNMKRVGMPDELITAVLYLASEASSFTTGADVIVDGGFTCR